MYELVSLEPVDYLVFGHVTHDLTPAGPRLGGTVAYSALTAQALGLKVGIITAVGPDTDMAPLQDIPVVSIPSQQSTTFENIYDEKGRRQILHHRADLLPFDSVPEVWRHATIMHLGPVAQEVEAVIPETLSPSLLGMTPQGWMRSWDDSGQVSPVCWQSAAQALKHAGAVVLSIEDVAGDEERIEYFAQHTRLLAVTEGAAGARLYWNGDQRRFLAPEMNEVDGTGAGDVFAATFFSRLLITRDPWEAARFATQLSAYSVSRIGLSGIPTSKEIKECLVEVF